MNKAYLIGYTFHSAGKIHPGAGIIISDNLAGIEQRISSDVLQQKPDASNFYIIAHEITREQFEPIRQHFENVDKNDTLTKEI